jgi:hypothetical protein
MIMNFYYKNTKTGATTENCGTAVRWFNEGVEVGLIQKATGLQLTSWRHEGE